jgi:hypothetical protein
MTADQNNSLIDLDLAERKVPSIREGQRLRRELRRIENMRLIEAIESKFKV